MTEFLDIKGGPRIAYDVAGEGPLIVLSHGIGDRRQAFRFLVPELARAGYRVAAADMRGHGESSEGAWTSISRTDVAGGLPAPPSWSAPSSRSARSPARWSTAWAACSGSAATGAAPCSWAAR